MTADAGFLYSPDWLARRGLWLLLLTLLIACRPVKNPDLAVGTLERDRLELIAEEAEPIRKIHVTEGQQVVAGQVLVELDAQRLTARLASTQAARDRAQAALAELLRGTRSEQIAEAQARLLETETAVTVAGLERGRAAALVESSVEAQRRLDLAVAEHGEASARRDAAQANLERLQNGATREELAQARAQLDEAEAALTAAQLDAERLRIVAPRAGQIDALPYEEGEQPPRGGVVVVMLASGAPYARVYLPAQVRPRVRPGTAAVVRVEGVAGTFVGQVRTVAGEAAFTPFFALTEEDRGRLSYLAEIDLTEDRARELPTGLPVEVTVGSP